MKILLKYNEAIWFYKLFLFVVLFGCNSNSKSVKINDGLIVTPELIYKDNFDDDLSKWEIEQMPHGKVELNEGKLEIVDEAGCTIWLKQKLEGPIMIEYDVILIDEGGPQDRVSDLNCFWMARDPNYFNNFFANSEKRSGKFLNYDNLKLYYMGVGGHYNTKTRFRRYSGNGEKPLLPEHDMSAPEYLLRANTHYRIKIIAYNKYIQYYRNNQLLLDFYDKEPYTSGYFGFRTVNNHMTVDNFKIYKLVM